MSFSMYIISVLPLLLGASMALDRVTSVVGGVALYTGTPVDVYNPLPSLIYNCDNLKAICANVDDYLDDNGFTMGNGLIFHYDASSSHGDSRRGRSCPTGWTAVLPFPCGSDPNQPNVMPGNLPARVGPLATWQNPEFQMEIPNLLGTGPSGMRYTCDEFPAASWIEGGVNNLPPYTSVYCAPKAVSCEGTTWNSVKSVNPLYPNTLSEQDWQGRAHSILGAYAKSRTPLTSTFAVMKFHFTTTNLGVGSAATAAQIVMPAYNNKAAVTSISPAKRDLTQEGDINFHCTGKFCEELENAGFVFGAPPPPSPSFQMFKAAGSEVESESPHATVHILTT